jgi:hypothetical protein
MIALRLVPRAHGAHMATEAGAVSADDENAERVWAARKVA